MKINEIIKTKRIQKGLTQEQVANYLGVSIPAVSKWESGLTYPDIVLLPALARLLDTDLNTLLSFKEDLTKTEIALFLNTVSETIDKQGFEVGYRIAMDKIKEYPNCDLLILNIAFLLDGACVLTGKETDNKYQQEIDQLYWRCSNSADISVKQQAQSKLISKLIETKDFAQAQQLIDGFTNTSSIDKKQLQANLYIAQNEFDKAALLMEEKLLATTNVIHSCLINLMDIAIKQNRINDAIYIANIDQQAAQLFDLWDYNAYVAHAQLYEAINDTPNKLANYLKMLKALTHKWDINASPLYAHIKSKEVDQFFANKLIQAIVNSLDKNETESLNKNSEFQQIINRINN